MQEIITTRVVDFERERAIRLWREGKIEASRGVLIRLLNDPFRLELDDKLQISANLAMIERDAGRVPEALQILLNISPLIDLTTNEELRGKVHNTLASIHQILSNHEQAFQEYTAAAIAHEKAGNIKYCADIENNLAALKVDAKCPGEAHPHLNRAEKFFKLLGEYVSIAQVDDTRARAYLAEGKVDEALTCAIRSVEYLRTVNEPRLLLVSLETLTQVSQAKRIHDALIHSSGITEAAHLLGIPHNSSLDYLINNKFPQLGHLRKPKTHSRRKR